MKIALIAPISFPISKTFAGGIESFLYKFSQKLLQNGHEVTLFASGDSNVPKVKIIPVCANALRLHDDGSIVFLDHSIKDEMAYTYKLMSNINAEKYDFDIYHFHGYIFLLMAMQNPELVKKALTTIHLPMDSKFITSSREAMGEKIKEINCITISDFQKQQNEYLRIIGRVYNGIDLREFDFRKKSNGYVGWLGRISPEKGVHLAVKMADEHGWDFKIAGKKSVLEYFDGQVRAFLNNKIKYCGELFDKSKSDFYGGCDVFVAPIQWDEPFGLTIVEAMACGTPVVAFNRGSMSELIVDGVTGYLIKPGDLKGFAEAVEKAKLLDRRKCREHVEKNFTLDKMTDEYISIYKKIIEKNG